jgi:hypothetical protein
VATRAATSSPTSSQTLTEIGVLVSISPTFLEQLLRQYSCANKKFNFYCKHKKPKKYKPNAKKRRGKLLYKKAAYKMLVKSVSYSKWK